MLSDRVINILELLDCSNTEIAYRAGCSSANFSRLRSGARVPSPESRTIQRFVDGVFAYADAAGKTDVLHTLCGAGRDAERPEIKEKFVGWLYESDSPTIKKAAALSGVGSLPQKCGSGSKKKKETRYFGNRLNAVIELLGISNARLARQLSVDPSLISRFRSGVRSPRSNPQLSAALCAALLKQAEKQNKTGGLQKLIGFSEPGEQETENLAHIFREWLLSTDKYRPTSAVDRLLGAIDNFSPDFGPPLLPIAAFIEKEAPVGGQHLYWGLGGLREAVLRFLWEAANNGTNELFLYSDQNMAWMTDDKEYFPKWFSLMAACVNHGVRIKIIHTFERDLSETTNAVHAWLPLYMSGRIDPFICRRKPDNRFSHTLFLRPGHACIRASHVIGEEEEGEYAYITDPKRLIPMEHEYRRLLSYCEPLVTIFTERNAEDYLLLMRPLASGSGDIASVLTSLSIGSMPDSLLCSILDARGISGQTRKNILLFHENCRASFMRALQGDGAVELYSLPSREDLSSGRVSLSLDTMLFGVPVFYTEDEFAAHIRSILTLLEQFPNYRVLPLPKPPFSGTQIVIDGNKVIVVKSNPPYAAFVLHNTPIRNTFSAYIDTLMEMNYMDSAGIRRVLLQYL